VFEECCNSSTIVEATGGGPINSVINNNKNSLCPDGFVHNPTLNVCDDIDECEIGGGHDCNPDTEVCLNIVGGFLCEPLDEEDELQQQAAEQKCSKGRGI
jgi:hypothetical protein